ncbi:MAG: cation:proton antiporter, partial [Muribaculaceae bacterium]|nr:cation:proton antiporter [Muribaculaceae bacterium]
LTIILIQCVGTADINGWEIALSFVLQFGVGVLGGWGLGRLAVWTINKVNLRNPELYLIMVLCFIFAIFSSVTLLKGNGYLAIYIAGIVMGNSDTFRKREIGTFLNGITWLVQVVMFVLLGLLVNPKEMLGIAPIGILAAVFMILVARPVSVWLSLLPFGRRISRKSKLFVSWVGLRGAAPILFATYPVVAGVEAGSEIFNIVFFVTLISLLVQGTTIAKAAGMLGLSDKDADEADHFGIELPDSIDSHLSEMFCTESMLERGQRLRELSLPDGQLVILVRRGDRYIVPNGRTVLIPGDILLLLSPDQ